MEFKRPALIAFVLVAAGASGSAFAAGGGGDYAPVAEFGVDFFTGKTGTSLTGATGFLASFAAEKRKGFFRTEAAAQLELGTGTATVGTTVGSFTLYGANFLGGFHLFPFTTGRFQPFVGGSAVLGLDLLKIPTPPSGVEANTQSLAFGYEASVGVDMRLGQSEGNALRVHGSFFSSTASSLASGSFQLNSFRLMLGVVY